MCKFENWTVAEAFTAYLGTFYTFLSKLLRFSFLCVVAASSFFFVLNCQIQGEINASAQQAWWVTMQSWPPCNFGPLVRSCKVANHNQKSYAGEKSKRTLEVMTHVKMIKVSWFFSMNVSIKLPVVSVYLRLLFCSRKCHSGLWKRIRCENGGQSAWSVQSSNGQP